MGLKENQQGSEKVQVITHKNSWLYLHLRCEKGSGFLKPQELHLYIKAAQ